LIGDERMKLLSGQCKCYKTELWNAWLLAIEHQVQATFLNYLKFSKFLICTNLIWKSSCISIMPISCPFLLITFFRNSTTYMIMAQGNKFQEIFIINVLELIMVKKLLQYVGPVVFPIISKCTITYVFKSSKIANACWVLTLMCDIYSTWFLRCFWELTLNWAHFCFVFVSFWTQWLSSFNITGVLCFTCNIETWQSLSVGKTGLD